MPDRGEVIKGLECCMIAPGSCPEECPYRGQGDETEYCDEKIIKDVYALLKAQEPRVMTLEEAKSISGYVFVQSRSCNILELQLIKDGFVYDSFTVPIAVDELWWEGYNKHWRLWTSVPTAEQMEAIPWN